MLTIEQLEDRLIKIHEYVDNEFDCPDRERDTDESNGFKIEYFLADAEDIDEDDNDGDCVINLTLHKDGRVEIIEQDFKWLEEDLNNLFK